MRGRQRAEVTVREGEDDDIPRRLLEVDGLLRRHRGKSL